jgi:hypothetical protein
MKKVNLVFIIAFCVLSNAFTSCRMVDFTVISSKNITLNVNKSAPRVSAWGFTIKDAVDKAIEKAGPNYDALIDGVVSRGVIGGYVVKGTPVKTSEAAK